MCSSDLKDSIYVFGDNLNTQSTTASDQYDKMISQKISTQTSLSETVQRIEYYNQRLAVLRKTKIGSTDKIEKTEADLASVSEKVKNLTELVELTADDYYQNFSLSDAYNVLVPASASIGVTVVGGIKSVVKPALVAEALLFVVYLAIVFIESIKEANPKKKPEAAGASTPA